MNNTKNIGRFRPEKGRWVVLCLILGTVEIGGFLLAFHRSDLDFKDVFVQSGILILMYLMLTRTLWVTIENRKRLISVENVFFRRSVQIADITSLSSTPGLPGFAAVAFMLVVHTKGREKPVKIRATFLGDRTALRLVRTLLSINPNITTDQKLKEWMKKYGYEHQR